MRGRLNGTRKLQQVVLVHLFGLRTVQEQVWSGKVDCVIVLVTLPEKNTTQTSVPECVMSSQPYLQWSHFKKYLGIFIKL